MMSLLFPHSIRGKKSPFQCMYLHLTLSKVRHLELAEDNQLALFPSQQIHILGLSNKQYTPTPYSIHVYKSVENLLKSSLQLAPSRINVVNFAFQVEYSAILCQLKYTFSLNDFGVCSYLN